MRILFLKLGAIGDVIHTLPALAALKRTYPDCYVAWVAERGGPANILVDNPLIDQLIVVNTKGWRKSLSNFGTLNEVGSTLRTLRGFDVAIDFQGLIKSAVLARLSGAPIRIGFDSSSMREPAAAILYNRKIKADDSAHIIKKNLCLLEGLEINSISQAEFPVGLSSNDLLRADGIAADGPFAIINPGGGWVTKLWNPASYGTLADRLWETYGLRSIVTYGPGEEALAASVAATSKSGHTLPSLLSLKELWAVCQKAQLFVGGDTGPLHIAAAAHTPIVGIYGPTPSARNGPFAVDDLVIERNDLDCRESCFRRTCSHISCMKIEVETVWKGVEARLKERGISR